MVKSKWDSPPIRWIDSVEDPSEKCRWSKLKGVEKRLWGGQGWNH